MQSVSISISISNRKNASPSWKWFLPLGKSCLVIWRTWRASSRPRIQKKKKKKKKETTTIRGDRVRARFSRTIEGRFIEEEARSESFRMTRAWRRCFYLFTCSLRNTNVWTNITKYPSSWFFILHPIWVNTHACRKCARWSSNAIFRRQFGINNTFEKLHQSSRDTRLRVFELFNCKWIADFDTFFFFFFLKKILMQYCA